jgi:hypothetical protein
MHSIYITITIYFLIIVVGIVKASSANGGEVLGEEKDSQTAWHSFGMVRITFFTTLFNAMTARW